MIATDQTNKGTRSYVIPLTRIFINVVIKLIAPKIDETPAKWSEKIAKSTEDPEWEILEDKGGYTVHPVPTPCSTSPDLSNKIKEGGKSQKLILFIRGKAISTAPNIKGTSQLPNPPIIIGITIKKIIIKAWAVTIVLYNWSDPSILPGWPNSARIRRLSIVPNKPAHMPNIKYKVPISLWLVEYNQRNIYIEF